MSKIDFLTLDFDISRGHGSLRVFPSLGLLIKLLSNKLRFPLSSELLTFETSDALEFDRDLGALTDGETACLSRSLRLRGLWRSLPNC